MKKGEEVETKVNVSDAFLFSQRPRSLVAFQVGLSSNLTEREDLASEFHIKKFSVERCRDFKRLIL